MVGVPKIYHLISFQLLAISFSNWQLAIGNRQLAIGNRQSAIHNGSQQSASAITKHNAFEIFLLIADS